MAQFTWDISRTFDDYLLLPWLTRRTNIPKNVSLKTTIVRFQTGTENALALKLPFVSAAMQSVSWPELAITLAREWGISFIYCSQPIEDQAAMIQKVKRFKAGFVESDSNLAPSATWADIKRLQIQTGHSTMPVTVDWEANGKLLWIVTSRDCRWLSDGDMSKSVKDIMTPLWKLIVWSTGISLSEANKKIVEAKIDCLPIIDLQWNLQSMVFYKDIQGHREYPLESLDKEKRLLVWAWINSKDYKKRVPALIEAGADIFCLDSSDGFSEWQTDAIKWIKDTFWKDIKVWAGNVVDGEGFKYLADAGADFVKIGIWGGAICTTRGTKGIWRGQASAIIDIAATRDQYLKEVWVYIPICSDGWIVHDHHITFALAMWADFVMMGRYFAGTTQSPWKLIEGRKEYWGEGSPRAQSWDRYDGSSIAEWVDSMIPYVGDLGKVIRTTQDLIRTTMANNIWVADLPTLRKQSVFTIVSESTQREGWTGNVILRE